MSLIFATQLTAVATAVLAVFAIVTAWYARRAFLKQSEEVREQGNEIQRAAADRRRAQAAQVFTWLDRHSDIRLGQAQVAAGAIRGETVTAFVRNTSKQPVYDPEFVWYLDDDLAPVVINPEPLPILLPGEEAERVRPIPAGAAASQFSAVLRFRDAAGVRWQRRPDGYLDEIPAQQDGEQ